MGLPNTTYLIGLGANLAQIVSVAVPVLLWKMVNCHVPWCWRHGKHPVEGTGHKVCDVHHTARHHKLLLDRVERRFHRG